MTSRTARVEKLTEAGMRRRERMRLILIEASTRLFARQGVDATTIDEIVDVAGVAKGTFYNYFTDRADIARTVAAVIRHEFNNAVEEFNRGIADPAERVSRGVRLFLAAAVRRPDRARMLARLYEGGVSLESEADQHLLGDLAEGLRTGCIRVPSLVAAHHVVVGIATVGMRHVIDGGAGPEILRGEGYSRDLATGLLQGLGAKPAEIERILKQPFDVSQLATFTQEVRS